MTSYRIENAVYDLIPIFTKEGYSPRTICELKRNIQKVVALHRKQEEVYYNPKLVANYISSLEKLYDAEAISRSYKNARVKAALYVRDFATTGAIAAGVKEPQNKLPLYYREIIEAIRLSNDWSKGMIKNIAYAAHTYFLFLADSGIQDTRKITEEIIRSYFLRKATVISPNSIKTIRRNLKHLHHWLYKNEYVQSDFSDTLSFTTPLTYHIKKPSLMTK